MGKALEWLGEAGCKAVAMEILTHPKPHGNEVGAHCPFHSERTPGGAFSYNPVKDAACCKSCGRSGDLITVYTAIHGLSEEDGFTEFKKKYGKDTPYQAQGTGRRGTVPVPKKEKNYFEKNEDPGYLAPSLWKERAWSFVTHSWERLMNNQKALDELNRRWHITEDTVTKHMIGINDADKYPPFPAWGLPSHIVKGKEKKVWLPKGLVLPLFIGEEVRKIKIRRPDPKTPWGELLPYVEVRGGEDYRFHVYGNETQGKKLIVVITEAERDALLVHQECPMLCDLPLVSMAGGGAAKRPHDEGTLAFVHRADVILAALDNDNPGRLNAVNFWEKEFGYAKFWPTPIKYGKDVGEAAVKGMDVRAWLKAGLPEYMKK
jgi:hypothetical protein